MEITVIIINLATLTILEIILGIDNLVFISIVSSRLPPSQQKRARRIGLLLALVARLALLSMIYWIVKLNTPLFQLFTIDFSGRDIFMFLGGMFLLVKGTMEIHHELDYQQASPQVKKIYQSFFSVITQIIIFDLIFSLDSILTAVGLTKYLWIMMIAITIAIVMMLIASEPLSRFIKRHPTVKMLALSFLLLIGMVLIADGLGFEIPKGYIYFSICFSLFVEGLNTYRSRKLKRARKKSHGL